METVGLKYGNGRPKLRGCGGTFVLNMETVVGPNRLRNGERMRIEFYALLYSVKYKACVTLILKL